MRKNIDKISSKAVREELKEKLSKDGFDMENKRYGLKNKLKKLIKKLYKTFLKK